VRIIAGELKGRRLQTPKWHGLRPTSDKLRETLFNVVSARVAGARVLDLYAGTGAVGLEALSRGAAHVTFVDADRRAVALIEQNLRHCGVADRYAIIRFRLVPEAPALPAGSFDLIVLDPPYDEPDLAAVVAATMSLIALDGLVVLEHARRRPSPELVGRLRRTREVVSGDSALAFYAQDRLTP
jgi:16S rRNA (guanine(966)-N(2))-methyltransferase RsmD